MSSLKNLKNNFKVVKKTEINTILVKKINSGRKSSKNSKLKV